MRESRIAFKPVEDDDILYLAEHLREDDVNEMQAVHGRWAPIGGTIYKAVQMTPCAQTAVTATGEPIAIFGIAEAAYMHAGVPWLLATQKGKPYARELIVQGREFTRKGLERYGTLFNYVDARNKDCIRWLKHIGFTLEPARPYGANGLPFHLFHASADGIHVIEAQR